MLLSLLLLLLILFLLLKCFNSAVVDISDPAHHEEKKNRIYSSTVKTSFQITKLPALELFFLLRHSLAYIAAPSSSYAPFIIEMENERVLPELNTGTSRSFSLLEQILLCTTRHLHYLTWDFILNPQCYSSVTSGQGIFKQITGRRYTLFTASDSGFTDKAGRFLPMMGWGWWERRVNNLFPVQFSALSFRSTNWSLHFLSQMHLFRTWNNFE